MQSLALCSQRSAALISGYGWMPCAWNSVRILPALRESLNKEKRACVFASPFSILESSVFRTPLQRPRLIVPRTPLAAGMPPVSAPLTLPTAPLTPPTAPVVPATRPPAVPPTTPAAPCTV